MPEEDIFENKNQNTLGINSENTDNSVDNSSQPSPQFLRNLDALIESFDENEFINQICYNLNEARENLSLPETIQEVNNDMINMRQTISNNIQEDLIQSLENSEDFNANLNQILEATNINNQILFDLNNFNLDEIISNLSNNNDNFDNNGNSNLNGGQLFCEPPIINEFHNKKWNATQKRISFKLANNEMTNFYEANSQLDQFFQTIYDNYMLPLDENYFVQYIINHDTFDRPISSCYMKRKYITVGMLQGIFDLVIQSRKKNPQNEIQPNHLLSLELNILPDRIIRGGMNDNQSNKRSAPENNLKVKSKRVCKEKREIINMNDYIEKSRFIRIINADNFCLIRAILIGKAFADKEKNAKLLERKNNRKLNELVSFIVSKLQLPDEFLNLNHLKILDNYFNDYQITLYDNINNGSEILYPDKNNLIKKNVNKFINIVYENNHYNVITSMTAYLGCSYFCEYCKVKYSNLGGHICNNMCKSCKRMEFKCEKIFKEACKACGIFSNNGFCKSLHDLQQCPILKICEKCKFRISKKHGHVCGINNKWCLNCKESVDYNHKCFIKNIEKKNQLKNKFKGYIWFDIEAFVNSENYHEANLIMAKRLCILCLNNEKVCDLCLKKYEFTKIENFVSWALSNENKHFVFISHNGKAYDNYFIMRSLQKTKTVRDLDVSAVTDGQKILSFKFRTLIFKDSSLFITRPLESFSKTFNLTELKKGFFPHEFNREENFSYVGKYPDKSYYKSEYFPVNKKLIFEKWYESVKNNVFDFQKELREYCWSDVLLLAEGCLQFRKFNIEGSKIDLNDCGYDPFQENLTTSSYCNSLYRRNFMPKDSISWIPANGYNPKEKTSNKADQWLKYISVSENCHIFHANNGGEKKVGKYLLDGICYETKKIFEFQGCLYHGCEKCNGSNTFNPVLQVMNATLRNRTEEKNNYILNNMQGFELIEMWEHDWDQLTKKDSKVIEIIKNFPLKERLKLRDALYGGRTNALKLHYLCKPDEKIFYYDFTSLYPAVQKYGVYPGGHPKILTENFDYKKDYFGIIKCVILPPRGLYIPVLPLNINGKLIFTLCYQCAYDKNMTKKCDHSDEKRALTGTWVSLEIKKAIEKGYKLIKYDEIYEFEIKHKYNKSTKKGGLFTDYVNYNLKEKQEASGFPSHCLTEAQKEKYIKDYYDIEGVLLDKKNIIKNPGKREIAKIKLNCLWGYFALNSNKTQFKIIKNKSELENLLNNDQFIVHNIDFKDENFVQVSYSENVDFCFGSLYTNVIIAAFVTAQARLKLYNELDKLGSRVLYFDTDSVFFVTKEGDYVPKLGDFLGEFTNEIEKEDGNYISEFISGGPKNYAIRLDTGITDCTVKGYPINYLTNLLINFKSIKECVVENQKKTITIPQLKFIKDKSEWLIKTEFMNKIYRFVYDKRILLNDLSTLPFGY